ncbi:MAG TPA: MMPL family transporter [Syntrophaceticus sp.]|nr:MMPL family transporter [Syntrophaceticus sp.]
MLNWSYFVVKYRKLLLIIASILLIPSLLGYLQTEINYDVTSYLPQQLASKQGQDILERDFRIAANSYVMVENWETYQIVQLKEQIEKVPGVEKASWLDDLYHPSVPAFFIPEEIKRNFTTDNASIIQVQFTHNSISSVTQRAVDEIRQLAGSDAAVVGFPVIIRDLNSVFRTEQYLYILIAVIAIFIVLSLSTSSNLQPLLLLIAVGFSVIYNLGSNVLLGSVSYITQAIAAVLQLAVTMDYGIFLIHRFEEEKEKHDDPEEAMAIAVSRTSTAIASSALTTVAGFMALIAMHFGLGQDMGIVLAKGVVLSLICILLLLPGLLLIFQKPIERTSHRILIPSFAKAADLVVKKRAAFILLFLVLIIPSFLLKDRVGVFYSLEKGLSQELTAVADSEKLRKKHGVAELVYLIVEDQGLKTEQTLTEQLKTIPEVKSVNSLVEYTGAQIPEEFIPEDILQNFRAGKYALCTIELGIGQADSRISNTLKEIKDTAASFYDEVYLSGEAALTQDLKELTTKDLSRVNMFSAIAIAIIVALTFASLTLPIILVMAIQFAIWLNLSGAFLSGTELYFVTYLVLGSVQLGATVDYAILLTSKYKEALQEHSPKEAMRQAVEKSGRFILTSSLTLTTATIAVASFSKIKMAGQMCGMLGIGAFISMLTIIFILPALLLLCDRLVTKTSWRWPVHQRDSSAAR